MKNANYTREALKAAGFREKDIIQHAAKITARRDGFRGCYHIVTFETADGRSCEYCTTLKRFTN